MPVLGPAMAVHTQSGHCAALGGTDCTPHGIAYSFRSPALSSMRTVTLVLALLAAGAFEARQPALLQAGDVVVTNETPCEACGSLLAMLQVFAGGLVITAGILSGSHD